MSRPKDKLNYSFISPPIVHTLEKTDTATSFVLVLV